MRIIRQPSYAELSTAQLISRIKWERLGDSPQSLYGIYVKYRGLKPDIDMSEFLRIYELVVAKSYEKTLEFNFAPTHETMSGIKVMVLPETQRYGDVVDIILEYGGYGTERLHNLRKIDGA